jgi:hypothetical protein
MKREMRYLFVCLALSLGCEARGEAPVDRKKLLVALGAIEQGPERAWVDAASEDGAGALMALARDKGEKQFYRARAIEALALYAEDPRVFPFFEETLRRPEALGGLELPAAIRAVAAAYGEARPEEVTDLLLPLRSYDLPVVKENLRIALARVPSPRAKEAIGKGQ